LSLENNVSHHDYQPTGKHKRIPIEFSKRRLREDTEVTLELLERLDNGGGAVRAADLGRKWHDVLGLLLLGLGLEVAGPDLDVLDVLGEERQNVDIGVLEQLIAGVLSEGLAEMGLVLAVWLEQFCHWCLGMLGNVLDQARQGHWEGWERLSCHVDG
jgi:hypothetical protein